MEEGTIAIIFKVLVLLHVVMVATRDIWTEPTVAGEGQPVTLAAKMCTVIMIIFSWELLYTLTLPILTN